MGKVYGVRHFLVLGSGASFGSGPKSGADGGGNS